MGLALPDYKEVADFPGYTVTETGWVSNDKNGRVLRPSKNQEGINNVALYKNHHQYRRSVALLVAKAFVPPPPSELFDTIIHLDGNKDNCAADNLAWRPRWFAIKYHRQFNEDLYHNWTEPLIIEQTGAQYDTVQHAITDLGLLGMDVWKSVQNHDPVFPTGHIFRVAD